MICIYNGINLQEIEMHECMALLMHIIIMIEVIIPIILILLQHQTFMHYIQVMQEVALGLTVTVFAAAIVRQSRNYYI